VCYGTSKPSHCTPISKPKSISHCKPNIKPNSYPTESPTASPTASPSLAHTASPTASPSVLPTTYLGCYADRSSPNRILPHWAAANSNPNGRIQSSALCKIQLAGTQNSQECWCGNSLNGAQPVSNNDCNMQCLGNAAEMCGGP